jgi:hypothetical protein
MAQTICTEFWHETLFNQLLGRLRVLKDHIKMELKKTDCENNNIQLA